MTIDWGNIITQVLVAVLTLALPVVLKLLADWLKLSRDKLLSNLDSEARYALEEAVRIAVAAAEQSGLANLIRNEAEVKKNYAIGVAEKYLQEVCKLNIDLDIIADAIEAEVNRAFPKPGPEPEPAE